MQPSISRNRRHSILFHCTFIVFLVLRGIRDTTNGFRLIVLLKSDTVFRLRFYVVFIVDVMNQFQVKI